MSFPERLVAANRAEARGDWSGLKGSFFHLLYAVKLALADGLSVSFYDGNDLGASARSLEKELWVQLKSTGEDDTWSIFDVLGDATLFPTLVRNALQSQSEGHAWQAQLSTSATIKKEEIEQFLADPASIRSRPARAGGKPPLPPLSDVFDGFVASCHSEWDGANGGNPFNLDDVRTTARTVLKQIANSPRVGQEDVVLRIDLAIAQRGYDVEQSKAVRQSIIGAVSREAAPKELQGVTVDREWVARETGYQLLADPLLSQNAIETSSQQVRRIVQHEWKEALCFGRSELHEALEQFRVSDRSLFLITGESGTGKTWGMAYEAAVADGGRIRAFLPADAAKEKGLADALADEFKPYAHPQASKGQIVRHLTTGAATLGRGPMIVYVDDWGVYDAAQQDANRLAQLVREAEGQRIKIVLSMRYGVWHLLSRAPALQDVAYLRAKREDEGPKASFEMPLLDEEELAEYVRRRRPEGEPTETLIRWIQQPSQSALRNGYLLNLFLDQYLFEPNQVVQIDNLLDKEFERRTSDLALRTDIEEDLASDAMHALITAVWNAKPNDLTRPEAIQAINATGVSGGDRVLAGLQTIDVLAPSGSLRTAGTAQIVFSNPQLAERASVRHLIRQRVDPNAALGQLRPGIDDGVVTILTRSGIDAFGVDSLFWAEAVIGADPAWIPAVCRGLSQRSEAGWRIPAYLSATANAQEEGRRLAASFALGDMTYHSKEAQEWLTFQFSDDRGSEGFMARLAMGQAVKSYPSWTVELVKSRLGECLEWKPTKDDDRAQRASQIRSALYPLEHLSDARGARMAIGVLRDLRRRDPLPPSARDDVRWIYDYDVASIRGAAAAFGGGKLYDGLVAELKGGSLPRRRLAAYATRAFAFDRPDDVTVRSAFLDAFKREKSWWPLYLWALFTYAKRSPEGIADAISQSGVLKSFRASLAFVICGVLAEHEVEAARSLLPEDLSAFDLPTQAVLLEPFAFAWTLVGMADPEDPRARNVLSALANLTLVSTDKLFVCFSERGAAVAQLGLILLDIPEALIAVRAAQVFFHHWSFELADGATYWSAPRKVGHG